MSILKSKTDELFEQLEAEGKLTVLSDSEVKQIRDSIDQDMETFRYEFARKQAQSIEDTSKIVLNA